MNSYYFDTEQRIIHILLLKSLFIEDMGLLYGKTGISIFFAIYSKYANNKVYDSFADDLIYQVIQSIGDIHSINFASGLSGIGWGIEYLLQNGFIHECAPALLEKIDEEIMLLDITRLKNISLETGLEGIFHYILARFNGNLMRNNKLPFDKTYLEKLGIVAQKVQNTNLSILIKKCNAFSNNNMGKYETNIQEFIQKKEIDERKLDIYSLGIRSGLSGTLLNKIL